MGPAMTPEQWAKEVGEVEIQWSAQQNPGTWGGSDLDVVYVREDGLLGLDGAFDRKALAARCLHGQPFGFTWEDVRALRLCADNAERWASSRKWDATDHEAYEDARIAIDRIAALLPPEDG